MSSSTLSRTATTTTTSGDSVTVVDDAPQVGRSSRRGLVVAGLAGVVLVGVAVTAVVVTRPEAAPTTTDWSAYGAGSSVYDSQVPGAAPAADFSAYGVGSSVYDSQVPGE